MPNQHYWLRSKNPRSFLFSSVTEIRSSFQYAVRTSKGSAAVPNTKTSSIDPSCTPSLVYRGLGIRACLELNPFRSLQLGSRPSYPITVSLRFDFRQTFTSLSIDHDCQGSSDQEMAHRLAIQRCRCTAIRSWRGKSRYYRHLPWFGHFRHQNRQQLRYQGLNGHEILQCQRHANRQSIHRKRFFQRQQRSDDHLRNIDCQYRRIQIGYKTRRQCQQEGSGHLDRRYHPESRKRPDR